MNSGRNHMDQWLQQSAEMGNAPFSEADWQHMQQLLQPKKKRRFIVFWWVLGLLIGTGLAAYLLVGNDEKAKQADIVTSAKSKHRLVQDGKKVYSKDSLATVSAGLENQQIGNGNSGKEIPSTNEIPKHNTGEKKRVENAESKSAYIPKQPHERTVLRKTNLVSKVEKQDKKVSIDVYKKEPSIVSNDSIEAISTSQIEVGHQFEQGELARIYLNFSINPIKIVDSLSKKELPKDTSVPKKKKATNKNEWSFAAGYYMGNVPLESKGINTKLGYSIKMGSFSVQPSMGGSSFGPSEEQVHKHITIRPPTGTATTEVKTTTTYFTPASGLVLHPSLSIGWQTRKIKLLVGLQQNIVLNGASHTNRTAMDSMNYVIVPPGIVATKPYAASLFNGSRSLSLNFGMKYNVGKRWFVNLEYNRMLDYNTVEGILDERKKRMSVALLVGLRF